MRKPRYVESEFFKVDKYQLEDEKVIKSDAPFQMVSVLNGEGTMDGDAIWKKDRIILLFVPIRKRQNSAAAWNL